MTLRLGTDEEDNDIAGLTYRQGVPLYANGRASEAYIGQEQEWILRRSAAKMKKRGEVQMFRRIPRAEKQAA